MNVSSLALPPSLSQSVSPSVRPSVRHKTRHPIPKKGSVTKLATPSRKKAGHRTRHPIPKKGSVTKLATASREKGRSQNTPLPTPSLHRVLCGLLLPPSRRTHMLVDGPVSTLALLRAVAHLETIASQPCGRTADHAHTRKTRAWGCACIFALRDPTLVVHCCQIWSGLRPS